MVMFFLILALVFVVLLVVVTNIVIVRVPFLGIVLERNISLFSLDIIIIVEVLVCHV